MLFITEGQTRRHGPRPHDGSSGGETPGHVSVAGLLTWLFSRNEGHDKLRSRGSDTPTANSTIPGCLRRTSFRPATGGTRRYTPLAWGCESVPQVVDRPIRARKKVLSSRSNGVGLCVYLCGAKLEEKKVLRVRDVIPVDRVQEPHRRCSTNPTSQCRRPPSDHHPCTSPATASVTAIHRVRGPAAESHSGHG